MTKIACRASNRAFVGLPLCKQWTQIYQTYEVLMYIFKGRDPDFIALSVKRTGDTVKTARALNLCPKFLRR